MIDAAALLKDAQKLTDTLVDDLRERTETHDESRIATRGTFEQAHSAGRTDKTFEEWREDLLAQVASAWVLGCVFVRFCEDNRLVETPLLSGPGDRHGLARDHRAAFFADNPAAGDREWLEEVFGRYRKLPGTSEVFGERNPLWQLGPSADGAKALLELWWATDDEGRTLRHDFSDPELDTRFLGDLYQDLSEHARKQYALLQTPEFVEEFILDRTLDPAIETFGLETVKMIDPTCGSGHFLLGAFARLLERWRQAEPGTSVRELAQRALDAVNGVDINPFAAEIARFRLLVAALQACNIDRLADAPNFHINVAVGDSLLHGTRPGSLLSGTEGFDDALKHHYPTEDAEEAERILAADTYHCVVGNPPYITVSDKALSAAYRSLYSTCHRKYAASVPLTERFFDLASPAPVGGFVGMITANSFMQREMGRKLIEEFLPGQDLTAILDASGAHIPGHATDTIILIGRARPPTSDLLRVALRIAGESSTPRDPALAPYWSELVRSLDQTGAGNYIDSVDMDRGRLRLHPWSLQGGAAPDLLASLNESNQKLSAIANEVGFVHVTGEDDAFELAGPTTLDLPIRERAPSASGRDIRDWQSRPGREVLVPHQSSAASVVLSRASAQRLWHLRTLLRARRTFGGESYLDAGRPWAAWHQVVLPRLKNPSMIAFAEVATHNHFVPSDDSTVFDRTAPVIVLPDGSDRAGLLGCLNSSVGEFWTKQVCYNKDGSGEPWESRYQRAGTRLHEFPFPDQRPARRSAALLDMAANLQQLDRGDRPPTRSVLDELATRVTSLRSEMVAMQEELDWACYHLYGLTDDELTFPIDEVPPIDKGQRAFEIDLARRIAAGEATSTWFERHGSTPITETPSHWPEGYRQLVERRLELFESDRALKLLERPEYKRRWNWDDLADMEREAQERWLLDRIEAVLSDADLGQPEVTTVARLADQLWRDDDARAVAEDLAGADVHPIKLVGKLVASAGVPYLAAYRLKKTGMIKRQAWERTWDLQRQEDALDGRAELPSDHPDHLFADEVATAKKEAGLDKIPVPPKYKSSDFRDSTTWKLRGKLDVPKERFVLYPGTRAGADTSAVVGWAGWDHLQQARALAGLYTSRKQEGAEVEELTPLLAGIAELLPWVLQWYDEPDPVYGERMGQFFAGFLETERAAHGLSDDDLANWRP